MWYQLKKLSLMVCFFSWAVWSADFQPVDLNSASREQIDLLPGVGRKTADSIVDYRESHGGFNNIDELLEVEGVKPKLFEKLKGKVTLFAHKKRKGDKEKETNNPKQAPSLSPAPTLSVEAARRLIDGFSDEPTVQQVQAQAVTYANMNPERVISWFTRVRQAAWLPKLDLGVDRALDRGLSVRERTGDPNTFYTKDAANWEFRAKAEWRLHELVFHPMELLAARESVRVAQLRDKVVQQVTESFFQRRRVQVELKLAQSQDATKMVELALEEQRLTAEIDGLTGAWFSQQIHKEK